MTRIGVVGAGRVGAVLAAGLRGSSHSLAGHEIVAAAGESTASRSRIDALLAGVPKRKPTAVARTSDLLLLTVPDDMLANVVSTLVGAGAMNAGKPAGKVRLEGKEYVMQEGDVVEFRHSATTK